MDQTEIFNNRMKWASSCKESDALKGVGFLTRIGQGQERNCCLGKACRIFKLIEIESEKEMVIEGGKIIVYMDTITRYGLIDYEKGYKSYLPPSIKRMLNISSDGGLTIEGRDLAEEFLKKNVPEWLSHRNYSGLAEINDVLKSHNTLYWMGVLLEYLFIQEYLFGARCFYGENGAPI